MPRRSVPGVRAVGVVVVLVVGALLSAMVPGAAQARADGPVSRWIVVLKDSVADPGAVAAEQTDSGVETTHPDLAKAVAGSVNCLRQPHFRGHRWPWDLGRGRRRGRH